MTFFPKRYIQVLSPFSGRELYRYFYEVMIEKKNSIYNEFIETIVLSNKQLSHSVIFSSPDNDLEI